MSKYFSCEICFQDADDARAAIAKLTKRGIETKVFEGVVDPYSAAVFVGAWREGDASFETEKIVSEIADLHDGVADSFGVSDHEPEPKDFGFTAPEAA